MPIAVRRVEDYPSRGRRTGSGERQPMALVEIHARGECLRTKYACQRNLVYTGGSSHAPTQYWRR